MSNNKTGARLPSPALLRRMYKTMLRIRFCEESFIAPILDGIVRGPVHLYSGQEAIASGVCLALRKNDYIFGTHRSHGHFLAKGGSLKELVAEIYGREAGCSRGRGGSMHLVSPEQGMLGAVPIVAGTISLAVGSALAIRTRKEKRIAVSFFGDGATGEGVLYESLNFAALKKLPVLFVCENNLYSTHMPIRECRPGNNIFQIGAPFGIASRRVDGNDVLAVYAAAIHAVDRCRKGRGPFFLECLTYRLRGHVGPDDNIQGQHTDIRPESEVRRWRKKDPIPRFEKYLLKKKILKGETLARIQENIRGEIKAAHRFARESAPPQESDLKKYVYRE